MFVPNDAIFIVFNTYEIDNWMMENMPDVYLIKQLYSIQWKCEVFLECNHTAKRTEDQVKAQYLPYDCIRRWRWVVNYMLYTLHP